MPFLSAFRAAVYFKHMPIIAVFFGIVIRMFYKEHEPAHFHAEHQGQQAANWANMKAGRSLDKIPPLE